MSNILLIHIGTPKTGSSSIQHFCCENKELLLEHGWEYPIYEGYLNSQYKEINGGVFCYPDAFATMETTHPQWKELWEQTLHLLESHNVILSNETFWYRENRIFLKEALKNYKNIKVLVYLRRQDLYLESFYMQTIRHGERRDFQTFVEACLDGTCVIPWTEHREELKYLEDLREIEEIVGASNIIVRPFDKSKWRNGNLIKDFAEVLGIKLKGEQMDVTQNQALSMEKLELYLQFNRSMSDGEKIAYGCIARSASAQMDALFYPDFVSNKKYYLMDSETRKKIWNRYEKENEEIANRYCNGKELFTYDMPKGELWKPLLSDRERAEWGVRLKMYLRTYSEIHKHGLSNTMNILCKNRKFALYGFGRCAKELLERYLLPIDIVIDNALYKEKQLPNGMKVISAQEIKDWAQYFIVVTVRESREIEQQMEEHQLVKNRDYVLGSDYFEFVNWELQK